MKLNNQDIWRSFRVGKRTIVKLDRFLKNKHSQIFSFNHNGFKNHIHQREFEFSDNSVRIKDKISNYNKKMKLFYASSSHIYNDTKTKSQNENTIPNFNSNYGLTKYLGKEICDYYRKKKNVYCSTGILYSHVSKLSNKKFLINGLLSSIKKNKKKIKVKNLSALLDIISSKDAVKAMYKIMQLKKPGNFIISSNKLLPVSKIIETLKSLLNLKNLKIQNLARKSKRNETILKGNNSKILNNTNWKPQDNLTKILMSFLNK